MTQRILIIGSGAREHALAWRCKVEGYEVHLAPGNSGASQEGVCHSIEVDQHELLIALAHRLQVALVIIGPEQPLVDGLADRFRHANVLVFGPSQAAAQLEASKLASKLFMRRYGIPTPDYVSTSQLREAHAALQSFSQPPVIKPEGLTGGKGVVVADSFAQAQQALHMCLEEKRYGSAGATVLLEQRLIGQEISFFVITDGIRVLHLMPCHDHKRLLDGDNGPNTGGMGAYCPVPRCSKVVQQRILTTIVEPTLAGLRDEGRPFVGALFFGLIIDEKGSAHVLEYNCRFGDPEIQPLLYGLKTPIVPHLIAAAQGRLCSGQLEGNPAATVVIAAEGYPFQPRIGVAIQGLESVQKLNDVKVFHAGTHRDQKGQWQTKGGRVLGICARGTSIPQAIARAYEACDSIYIEGCQIRRDIGRS